ncbi:hypothetical protein [uncultured Arcticibacterium sp.]|uniref:hypothetical protein n=1 Tax=uncultured Arcticibacterium sp. TaxID=2173042 RepID=UPI0030F6BB4B
MNNRITQTGLFGTEKHYKEVKELAEKEAESVKEYQSIDVNGVRELGAFETLVKFKTQSITQVDVYRRKGTKRLENANAINNLLNQNGEDNAYNGYISPSTKRKLEQMLQVWLTAIEVCVDLKKQDRRVDTEQVLPTFVTLTLPSLQIHRDRDIKEHILHPFINWLKHSSDEHYKRGTRKGEQKGFGVNAFFWRAEPQKNGSIHFHVLVDRYVPWERIREKWNQCCEKLGYVTGYKHVQERYHKDGFRIEKEQFKKDCKQIQKIAEKIQSTRRLPKKIHPVFASYMETTVKYGTPIRPKLVKAAAREKQLKAYEEGVACGWTNPNSTDIHGIQNLNHVAAYVIKYVTKKPTEIPIQANQRVQYSEDFKRDCIHTFDYEEDPVTGEYHEVEQDMQFYKPQFEERKINGRLWGCSDNLRGIKLEEGQKVLQDENGFRYVMVEEEVTEPEIPCQSLTDDSSESTPDLGIEIPKRYIKRPFYDLKYYTKVVAEMIVLAPSDHTQSPIYSDREIVDHDVQEYLDLVTNKVGKNVVNSASLRVGPAFERMRGKIIPLTPEKLGFKPKEGQKKAHVKHSEILEKYAPELYKDYVAHHTHIFNCLYGKAA